METKQLSERMLQAIGKRFPLTETDVGPYGTMKVNGMKFTVRAFDAKGLGRVSVMNAAGFFGMMRMDTLMVTPSEIDMPLLSYDRVLAMGNDTLIAELYDTTVSHGPLPETESVREQGRDLPDHDPGTHWYDGIKRKESISKKGKKTESAAFDVFAGKYLDAFLRDAAAAPSADPGVKNRLNAAYVDGLLTHGGPSTDVFVKKIGREKTEELFRRVLFGTEA